MLSKSQQQVLTIQKENSGDRLTASIIIRVEDEHSYESTISAIHFSPIKIIFIPRSNFWSDEQIVAVFFTRISGVSGKG